MNNVLIDERRIKVDFSQSVSKMQQYALPKGWRLGPGKGKVSCQHAAGCKSGVTS